MSFSSSEMPQQQPSFCYSFCSSCIYWGLTGMVSGYSGCSSTAHNICPSITRAHHFATLNNGSKVHASCMKSDWFRVKNLTFTQPVIMYYLHRYSFMTCCMCSPYSIAKVEFHRVGMWHIRQVVGRALPLNFTLLKAHSRLMVLFS